MTESLARIRIDVAMVPTVNADSNGQAVVEHLLKYGAGTDYIVQVPERGMDYRMAIWPGQSQTCLILQDWRSLWMSSGTS
ncbi:hypothetical protein [Paenibacillus polymyxa]|uniref:hypothetical protein n=1 Tax=Paenibacillus polymyxa TaxID=1406 RepID=UPI000589CF76|nr:hypothetical protein [Paenibacillus polymyxa]AJE54290.1 hypothetical protein RE92_25220 [Paenibacillus polymyxa]